MALKPMGHDNWASGSEPTYIVVYTNGMIFPYNIIWGKRERAPTCGLNGRAVPIDRTMELRPHVLIPHISKCFTPSTPNFLTRDLNINFHEGSRNSDMATVNRKGYASIKSMVLSMVKPSQCLWLDRPP